MAVPRIRRDEYGRPFPTLAPAPASPDDRSLAAINIEVQGYVLAQLAATYQRGVHADIHIHLRVVDGLLRNEFDLQVNRHYTYKREEP